MSLTREEFAAVVRQRGMRFTEQRHRIYESVNALGHATPEAILAALEANAPGLTLSTVYRALEALEDLGLVAHTHLGHAPLTYHAISEHKHVHLVCEACGGVVSADVDVATALMAEVLTRHGFTVDPTHMAVAGRCRACTGSAGR